jgi:hypothetical protein
MKYPQFLSLVADRHVDVKRDPPHLVMHVRNERELKNIRSQLSSFARPRDWGFMTSYDADLSVLNIWRYK